MSKVVEFLNANPVQYLATVGRDGKAKCRPFMFSGEMDGKLWIRLHGKAVFENNMAAKEMCIANPIVKGQYGEATNPIFEVFYLENPHGVIADFSGNPPYEF